MMQRSHQLNLQIIQTCSGIPSSLKVCLTDTLMASPKDTKQSEASRCRLVALSAPCHQSIFGPSKHSINKWLVLDWDWRVFMYQLVTMKLAKKEAKACQWSLCLQHFNRWLNLLFDLWIRRFWLLVFVYYCFNNKERSDTHPIRNQIVKSKCP